jgi:hypothetical protein
VINSNITQSADVAITTNATQGYVTIGPGIYLLTILFGLKYTSAPTLVGIYLGGITSSQLPFGIPNQNNGTITCSASLVLTKTSTSNVDLFVQYFGGSGITTLASNIFTATRIA